MDDYGPAATSAPLFITGDDITHSTLRRLATTAGVEAHRAPDPQAARRHWNGARVVVIAADAARACADARLPPRTGVILLTGPQLPYDQAWPLALTMGASQVAGLPEAAAWLARQLAPAASPSRRATVVTITGARGGVGASVLAAATALTAADRGLDTVLIDADPRGGGLDVLLGWENRDGLRWPDLAETPGPFDPRRLRTGLVHRDRLGLLSFSRDRSAFVDTETAAAVLDAAARGHDLVIVDAPRYGEAWLSELVTGTTLLSLVVPAEVRAVAAARQAVAAHAGQSDRVGLIVTGPSPGKLSTADIVKAVGAPLTAELGIDPRIAGATESGELPSRLHHGGLAAAAQAVLTEADLTTPQLTGAPS